MYWRTSKLDIENKPLKEGEFLPELYVTNDDYALAIKFDPDDRHYPWCIMRPFGTRYGSELVNRYQTFDQAFNAIKEMTQEGS